MKQTLLTVSVIALSSVVLFPQASLGAKTIAELLKDSKMDKAPAQVNYNDQMRSFIEKISKYARGFKDSFVISVRNGEFLMKAQADSLGLKTATDEVFLKSVDGIFIDGYSYGYSKYDQIMYGQKNTAEELQAKTKLLTEYLEHGKFVGVFDHITEKTKTGHWKNSNIIVNNMKEVYNTKPKNPNEKTQDLSKDQTGTDAKPVKKAVPTVSTSESALSYVKEIDNTKPLNTVYDKTYAQFKKFLPKANAYSLDTEHVLTLKDYLKNTHKPKNLNSKPIYKLSQAKNFLYIANLDVNMTANELIKTLANTNYDVIIMNSFYKNGFPYKAETIEQLKYKKSGAPRLVLANMNVSVATKGLYYWQESWGKGDPSWLKYKKPNTVNSYFTKFWDPGWQYVITGHNQSYLYGIMLQHFDGILIEGLTVSQYFTDVSSGFTTPE